MHHVTMYSLYNNIQKTITTPSYEYEVGIDFSFLMQASEENMSDLESGMVTIIRVFHEYSGHKCKLKKAELKALIDNEMSNFIMVSYGT